MSLFCMLDFYNSLSVSWSLNANVSLSEEEVFRFAHYFSTSLENLSLFLVNASSTLDFDSFSFVSLKFIRLC
jgi:hypothetical protein